MVLSEEKALFLEMYLDAVVNKYMEQFRDTRVEESSLKFTPLNVNKISTLQQS